MIFKTIIIDASRYVIPRRKYKNILVYYMVSLLLLMRSEGFIAVVLHRCAYGLVKFRLAPVSFILSRVSLFLFGIYIHPGTRIEAGCKINHFGSCIHARKIGLNVEITHAVTIGQKKAFLDQEDYPEIGDNVYIGAGSRIFANIGDNVIIGANSVVLEAISGNCIVAGNPVVLVKEIDPEEKDLGLFGRMGK